MTLIQDGPARIDREIDAALKLLSEAQAPAAMVSRIQQSLEAAAAKSPQARLGLLVWAPAAGVAIAAILLLVFSQAHWASRKQKSLAETAKMTAPAPASEPAAAVQPLAAQAQTSQRKPVALAAVKRRRRQHQRYRHVANLLSYPLTPQEDLLVRFAQTAKPADLQMLNPEYQARVEARQEAEFTAYLKSRGVPNTNETDN